MSIEIREHQPGGDVDAFVQAGHVVYEGDPAWVAPLNMDIKDRLNPKKNPFFKRGECTLLTAWKNGKLVGRASAQIDREHLRVWNDATGFFGFFDTTDDVEVAEALLNAASNWLRAKGMKRMFGPFSLYVNEEIGTLIEGFDTPPMLMMSHARRYQAGLMDKIGLQKEKDLYAWRFGAGELKARAVRAWEDVKRLPEVKLRTIDTSRMEEEIATIIEIYNDAWKGKWCFVPALPDEAKKMAEDMKLLIDRDIAFIAEIDGKPAGMCIMLPNLNEAIKDLDGKLFPFGFAKLIYRLKVARTKSTRLMMLYGGLSAAMYVEVAKRGMAKGYEWAELSWTREDDGPINAGVRIMGAEIYKKYRVYKKDL
jgi:hypothetical protein